MLFASVEYIVKNRFLDDVPLYLKFLTLEV
jgi:hypothetical protein